MKNCYNHKIGLSSEGGAVAVYVALILVMLLGFTALAVDVGYLYGVRNELHNGADAGALAGAGKLFDAETSLLNVTAANDEALRVTPLNSTGREAIDDFTVQIGHWSFATKTFTENTSTTQMADWQNYTATELDGRVEYINAVRVEARRTDTPTFFAKIFGKDVVNVSADAVAYIGFAGKFTAQDFDQPIALCESTIEEGCNMGRMLNSGGNQNTSMTAMWTNFSQDIPGDDSQNGCDTANANDMKEITDDCSGSGDKTVGTMYGGVGTQNGVQDVVLGNIVTCWLNNTELNGDGVPTTIWGPITLPVIECGVDNTCSPLKGAVTVRVIWIQHKNDPNMNEVPTEMDGFNNEDGDTVFADWSYSGPLDTEAERLQAWKSFVDHFGLQNVSGPPSDDNDFADYKEMYQKKNIFFLKDCEFGNGLGGPGGENYGIIAKYPVLVE